MFVDKDSAYRLNSGVEKLEDILVLHLHGGKDFFISFEKKNIHAIICTLFTLNIWTDKLEENVQFLGFNRIFILTLHVTNFKWTGSNSLMNMSYRFGYIFGEVYQGINSRKFCFTATHQWSCIK